MIIKEKAEETAYKDADKDGLLGLPTTKREAVYMINISIHDINHNKIIVILK
jgi:hypothetical protein